VVFKTTAIDHSAIPPAFASVHHSACFGVAGLNSVLEIPAGALEIDEDCDPAIRFNARRWPGLAAICFAASGQRSLHWPHDDRERRQLERCEHDTDANSGARSHRLSASKSRCLRGIAIAKEPRARFRRGEPPSVRGRSIGMKFPVCE
jgi:hypothetical protein